MYILLAIFIILLIVYAMGVVPQANDIIRICMVLLLVFLVLALFGIISIPGGGGPVFRR